MTASADHFVRRSSLGVVALSVASLCAIVTASQASAQGTFEQRRACEPDVMRLCRSEIPNVPAITACLSAKRAQLSDACALVMFPNRRSDASRSRTSNVSDETE